MVTPDAVLRHRLGARAARFRRQRAVGDVLHDARRSTGDTTGGAFRFTCKDTHGTCKVSIQATGPDGTTVDPRVLIYKQDFNAGGPSINCEYGDGATNNGDFEPVGSALTMGIGGSLDCPAGTQVYPTGGTATTIDVPAGYYDVWSTFTFKQS